MTKDDIMKVLKVISAVDGGCSICALACMSDLIREFPRQDWPELLGEFQYYAEQHDEAFHWVPESADIERILRR